MEVLADTVGYGLMDKYYKKYNDAVVNQQDELITEKFRNFIEEALLEIKEGKVTRIHNAKRHGN